MKRINIMAAIAVLGTFFSIAGIHAQTVAETYDYSGGFTINYKNAIGYSFTPTTDINITSLGYFDVNSDGLADDHDVGIFKSDGTLVTAAFVPSGTVDPIVDGGRFTTITPVTLTGGTNYYILANNNSVDLFVASFPSALTFAPQVGWNDYRVASANSILSPLDLSIGGPSGFDGYAGPDFQFNAVPEVSAIGLYSLGLAILARLTLRRKRSLA